MLLIHVIEHFRSPRQALEKIATLIKPGGLFWVECPNIGAPFSNRPRLFHFAHIYNFTASSLTMLAQSCGFEVVEPQEDERNPTLNMLFRYTGEKKLVIDEDNYANTLEAIGRFDGAGFYGRPSYYWHRARKLAHYAKERFVARGFVERVLKRCQPGA